MSTTTPEVTEPTPPPVQQPYVDYWGTDEEKNWYFPDGIQYMTIKKMDEGAKSRFQKLTSTDMVIDRNQDTRVKIDPAAERHALITASVTGWNLMQREKDGSFTPAVFSKQMMTLWLEKADPKIVADLEHEIRMFNPWMLQEMPVEEIDKEIDRLQEMRKKRVEQDAGESTSTTK